MREVQRATPGASTSTAPAARSGGVLFGHGLGAALNVHMHLHLYLHVCVLDWVMAQVDEDSVERVQAAVRLRVLELFERRGILSSEMVANCRGGGIVAGFQCMQACGAPRRLVLCGSGCCAIVRVGCLQVSDLYRLAAGRKCATGCHGRRCRGTGSGSGSGSGSKDVINYG